MWAWQVVVLSDRAEGAELDAGRPPIPTLLAVGAVHHHLIRCLPRWQHARLCPCWALGVYGVGVVETDSGGSVSEVRVSHSGAGTQCADMQTRVLSSMLLTVGAMHY